MAPCIVCNEETKDVNEKVMATIRSRLEKVLDETVPICAVLCPSCNSDLNQIEIYYQLLTAFRRRYYDTAQICRQKMKATEDQLSRNVLLDSAEFNPKNLQGTFEASNSSANTNNAMLTLQAKTSQESNSLGIPPVDIKLEFNDVRSLQDNEQQNHLFQIESASEDLVVPQKLQVENQQLSSMLKNSEQTVPEKEPPMDMHAEVPLWFSALPQCDFVDSDTDDTVLDEESSWGTEEMILPNLFGTSIDSTKFGTIPPKCEGEDPKKEDSDDMTTQQADVTEGVEDNRVAKRKRGRPRKHSQIEFPHSHHLTVESRQCGRPKKTDIPAHMPIIDSMLEERSEQRKNKEPNMFPTGQSVTPIKKCGRPGKHAAKNEILNSNTEPSSDRTIIEEDTFTRFVESSNIRDCEFKDIEQLTSPTNTKSAASSDISMPPSQKRKRGRPRKNHPGSLKTLTSEKLVCSESAGEECDDALRLKNRDAESLLPTNMASGSSVGSPVFKRKRGRPRKVVAPDLDFVKGSKQKQRVKSMKKSRVERITAAVCAICNAEFPDRPSLKSHKLVHMGDKTISCTFCGKEFKSPSALEQHESVHTGKKRFQCEVCGKGVSRASSLRMHLSTHNEVKSFECDKCNKKFKNQKYLDSHINKHHVQGRHVLCTVCGKAFFTEKVLKIHMLMHNEERVKSFKCRFCDMAFYTKGELGHHEGSHKDKSDRKKYVCKVCGKAFIQSFYLKYHMVTHTKESKHRCAECDQVFKTPSELQRHIRIHTGEKPYGCITCGKAFRVSSNLYTHQKIHTGERPFECVCGASFLVKTMLDKHMRTKKHAAFVETMKATSADSEPMVEPESVTAPYTYSWTK